MQKFSTAERELLRHRFSSYPGTPSNLFLAIRALQHCLFALFSGLAIDGSAGELIHPFFPPEKQCHGSRSCVAADGGSDVVDLDFSVQIGKAFLDKIRNGRASS